MSTECCADVLGHTSTWTLAVLYMPRQSENSNPTKFLIVRYTVMELFKTVYKNGTELKLYK